jgi:hypothetical protein
MVFDKYAVKITTGKCVDKRKLFVNKFAKNIQQVFLENIELICFMVVIWTMSIAKAF